MATLEDLSDDVEVRGSDARRRLVSAARCGFDETYGYHANGTMASSSSEGEELQFRHYESGDLQLTNHRFNLEADEVRNNNSLHTKATLQNLGT